MKTETKLTMLAVQPDSVEARTTRMMWGRVQTRRARRKAMAVSGTWIRILEVEAEVEVEERARDCFVESAMSSRYNI